MKLDFPQRSALQLLRSRTGKCRQLPVGRIRYRDHAITHNPAWVLWWQALPCAHEFDGVDPDPEGLVSRSLGHDGMAMVGRECLDGAHVGTSSLGTEAYLATAYPAYSRLAPCRRCTTASAAR